MRRIDECTRLRASLLALLGLAVGACTDQNAYVEPPPPKVTVATPLIAEVTDYLDFTGTTEASARVEVRARVAGVLVRHHFIPGTHVDAGDLLFSIDPKEYEADLMAAEAEVAGAEAEGVRAETELARAERLFKQQAASDAEVVKWRGEREVAAAAALRAKAKVERARLNLSYTEVVAPISGRVGRNLVDDGNLVGQGEATILTDLVRYDPMFVYFALNERDLLRVRDLYRERVEEKALDPTEESDAKAGILVEMGLTNEPGYPHAGVLDFAESGLDPQTGTLRLRGSFDNGDVPYHLVPGLFTRVRMPIAVRADMRLVSDRAVGSDQTGRFVLVVTADDKVEKRSVEIGRLVDGLRVIEKGIEADERVVVNGLQRARPGVTVDPETIDMSELSITQAPADAAAPRVGVPAPDAPDTQPAEGATETSG